MITNTVAGLDKVIDMLWEIEDTARATCGQEGYDAIQDVIKSAQIAWNVCKNAMESKGYKPLGNSRKAIKSGNNPSGSIVKITGKDIQDAIDTIMADASATWYKKLYSFGDGTSLYFCAGVGEGFDENDENVICGKIACMPDNSGMAEYNYDFIMPYDEKTGDVYDTDGTLNGPDDYTWYNKAAEDIVKLVEKGKLVTSACHGKSKKKDKKKAVTSKSIKSSFELVDSCADESGNWKQYEVMDEETLDKIKDYLIFEDGQLQLGNVFVNVIFDIDTGKLTGGQVVDTESSTWDLSPAECREIMGKTIESSRKSIESGMSYEQALAGFTSMGKPWGDYWSMQEDWAFYVDSLTRDGEVDYEEARWWDNPCTPETFKEWINSSKSIKSSDDIMDVSDDEEPIESCVKRNRDSINTIYK